MKSVNDCLFENIQVIVDNRDNISELLELKTKVDTLVAATKVKVSSLNPTTSFTNKAQTLTLNLKGNNFIGVAENPELQNQNDRFLNDENSTETICFGIGVDVTVEDCRRLGRSSKTKIVLVTFSNVGDAR